MARVLYTRSFPAGEPVPAILATRRLGQLHLIRATIEGPDTVIGHYGSYSARHTPNRKYPT